MESNNNHHHDKTKTTFRIRANHPLFSCGIFCKRITDKDVVDPKDTKPQSDEGLTIKHIRL